MLNCGRKIKLNQSNWMKFENCEILLKRFSKAVPDFMFSCKKIFLRKNPFFGFQVFWGNPKSGMQNPNPDFPIESTLTKQSSNVADIYLQMTKYC